MCTPPPARPTPARPSPAPLHHDPCRTSAALTPAKLTRTNHRSSTRRVVNIRSTSVPKDGEAPYSEAAGSKAGLEEVWAELVGSLERSGWR